MKKLTFLLLTLVFATIGYGQPINDDCDGIIDLGQAPFDSYTTVYNNIGATPSDIGNDNNPSCFFGLPERDVWFKFQASDTIENYNIRVVGTPDQENNISSMQNPEIAIYRGATCGFDNLFLYDCASSSKQYTTQYVSMDTVALIPGFTYYLRVNNWNRFVPEPGGFQVFVTELLPLPTIENQVQSRECTGVIYDSGGANGKYENNEDHSFTICPDAEHSCLEFTLEFYDLEANTGLDIDLQDQILFYDGMSTAAPQIARIGSFDEFEYSMGVVNGGGVDYKVKAKSGCLTVRFISDLDKAFSGFKGSWRCLPEECKGNDPISIDTNATNQAVLENLARPNIDISLDTIICNRQAYGVFNLVGDEIGITDGLFMCSGKVSNAIGPNFEITIDGADDDDLGGAGDADLDSLSKEVLIDSTLGINRSFDACIVEVDVFVPTDEISFDYVFGSEEFPEFTTGNFNDIFAFLISGPDIEGDPSIRNQENLAVLPGTDVPIQINSVNTTNNWEYYKSLEYFENSTSYYPSAFSFEGLIVDKYAENGYLTAVKKVTPCNTYHLKFAISDRGDGIFNSGVLISRVGAGSPSLGINYSSGLDYFVEYCTEAEEYIEIKVPGYFNDTITYNVAFQGTATRGEDFICSIPNEVTFVPSQTVLRFPFSIISDNLAEGSETVEIILSKDYGCGSYEYDKLTLEIKDAVAVDISASSDTVTFCEGSTIELDANGADTYAWYPQEVFDNNRANPAIVNPTEDIWVKVVGKVGVCASIDSVYLSKASFDFDVNGNRNICPGTSSTLSVQTSQTDLSFQWNDENGSDLGTAESITVSPDITTSYFLTTYSSSGCDSSVTEIPVSVYPSYAFSEIMLVGKDGIELTPEEVVAQRNIYLMTSPEPVPPNATYKWYINNNLISTTNTPTSDEVDMTPYFRDGMAAIKLEILDENGCSYILEKNAEFDTEVDIEMPNVFSPDGDRLNDRFKIVNKGSGSFEIVEFKIFNRWGNMVYDNENGFDGWDGTYKGEPAPPETYVYKIRYRTLTSNEVEKLTGEITLLR